MPVLRILSISMLLTALSTPQLLAEDWPQWRGPGRDGVWTEQGVIETFNAPQIEIKWRRPVSAGYSGPTVADGRVFITDRVIEPEQIERTHCFAAETGEPLWMHEYPCPYVNVGYQAGPRAAVTIDDGQAYALGAMGHLHCYEAATGKVLWKKDLGKLYEIQMPIWGVAASPLVFENLLIVQIGGKDKCIVALDKNSGEEAWTALADRAQYSSPILVEQAGRPVVVCWTGDSVAGLNPASGEVYWREVFTPVKMPIGIATPIVQRDRLFVTSFYDGALMLRLKQDELGVDRLWHRNGRSERDTDALQSIISTPLFQGDHIYGCDSYGELRCLKTENGDRIWEDKTATPPDRWSNLHFVANADRVWMFNEAGELIIAKLSPEGFDEISRAKLIEPTRVQLRRRGGKGVCWSHPAFAGRCVFARNDEEIVCASLAK
jgi:outer membrane protein assembly factor BamB